MKSGVFSIFQWNNKDLFLKDDDDQFVVLSHQELPKEFFKYIDIGRKVKLDSCEGGWTEIRPMKTPKEENEEHEANARHAKILVDIAGLEAMGESKLPPYALNKLKTLRLELQFFEPLDPTAITLEAKRSNASVLERQTKMFLKRLS